MAGMLQFDLVSPERRLASFAATEVGIPSAMGDLTAMAGHEATITTLRPGLLRAIGADGARAFAVTGGFAEITAASVSVLAEQAIPVDELTGPLLDTMIDDARKLLGAASPGDRDAAEKLLHDMIALKASAGH
jgi:F-type H+-transporting ATPase subunit epsilon